MKTINTICLAIVKIMNSNKFTKNFMEYEFSLSGYTVEEVINILEENE